LVDAQALARQVRENCEICNCRHAGGYSLCGLLLRLRNLYKWEHGLQPWEEPETSAALDWVAAKEASWEALAEEAFRPLEIGRASLDPLDAAAVNRRLRGSGLIYGAGYGWGLRPSFFLGRLTARRRVGGHTVLMVGLELARDLFSAPAMLSEDIVVARAEPAAAFLWDRLHDVKKSGQPALLAALAAYGLTESGVSVDGLRAAFPSLLAAELESYIRHEIGELDDTGFPRDGFRKLVVRFPGGRVELVARAVKDALADTGPRGRLAYIIGGRRLGSLGLYVAFLDGVRKLVLAQIPAAFRAFRESDDGDWSLIEAARREAYDSARGLAARLLAVLAEAQDGNVDRDDDWARSEIEERVIKPLGI
jgi:hypothetical protein